MCKQMGWKAESRVGVVAAGGAEAVAAGIQMLFKGGNAADAAAAVIFALNITDHMECSIGGEVPIIYYDAQSQAAKVLSGQGRAPRSQTAIDWYMANGIPDHDMKMAPVPSVVDSCITMLMLYGTMTFEEIIAPVQALLEAGNEDWHPKLARTIRKLIEEEKATSGSREDKLQAVTDRFYGRNKLRDDIARELEADYMDKGGFLRREDLAAHVTTVEEPVTVNYKGYTVCKCGPWTQGPVLCQALRLLEGFDLKSMGYLSDNYVHVVTEAMKLALADRDEYYGDPAFVEVPIAELLSDAYTELRRPLIHMKSASLEARPGDPYQMKPLKEGGWFRPGIGGTTTCVIADRWGNVVSATPSANVCRDEPFGGTTGVTYGNRLRSFNSTPGHPNCIQAGKRPRSTLTPTLVLKNGKPVLAISVAGGDYQDQTALNVLLNFIEFGMAPESAVTAPRFATMHYQDSFNPDPNRAQAFKQAGTLTVSDKISQDVIRQLAERGHQVESAASPIAVPVMLHIDQESGVMYAAGDPTAERHAAGLGN